MSTCAILINRALKKMLDELDTESILMKDHERKIQDFKQQGDSRCLICGTWHYNKIVEKCPKCGGLCRVCPPDELAKSTRFQHAH